MADTFTVRVSVGLLWPPISRVQRDSDNLAAADSTGQVGQLRNCGGRGLSHTRLRPAPLSGEFGETEGNLNLTPQPILRDEVTKDNRTAFEFAANKNSHSCLFLRNLYLNIEQPQ